MKDHKRAPTGCLTFIHQVKYRSHLSVVVFLVKLTPLSLPQCHVPTWLQNTHVYSWPRDRDDVLRRLMRVEKYNPPPIGKLPTIISIPI
uniref:Uncharacterized protein n=1 Tax=Hucho hucho TaxID=62062 RepID=A0A4W5QKC1_9TELE